jgi:xanthine/CO dehydrogenase XdhC/CoxF family maturation factor
MAKEFATGDAIEVLETALQWHSSGKRVALATVVATWGSSPCPVGSQLAVDSDGQFVGSVSGGCVEAAVIAAALEVIGERRGRVLDFGVSNQTAWEVGLACGGRIQIYLEPIE